MADGYARAVVDGTVRENPYIVLAASRYLEMRKLSETHGNEYFWSDAHVVEVCAFCEACPQGAGGDGDGATIQIEPWQAWIVAAVFGFRVPRGDASVRYVVEVLVDVARKNGKSAFWARIDLYCFLYEAEQVSEVFLAASTREQAKKVYSPIRSILLAADELVADHGLKVTSKEIRKPDGGVVTTISANGKKEDGHNPHVAHIDELHAVPSALHEVMASSMGARANQLFLKTTTAGVFASGPAYEERKRAERILRGIERAPRYFAAIYTVPPEEMKDPLRWENVCLANPMVEAIPTLAAKLRDDLEASKFDPKKRAEYLTKRLNVYAGGAHHALTEEQWNACYDPALKIEDFFGKRCWVGADLSSHDDQTAVVAVFEDGDDIVLFCWHFLPEDSPPLADEEMADHIRDWSESGWMTLTPGSLIDHDTVQKTIEQLATVTVLDYAVFDQAQSVQIAASLQKKNIKAGLIRSTPAEVSEPTKDLVTRARAKRLRHNGNPVLAWNARNTCLRPGDLWKPVKDKTAPHLKIDGISAAVHANTARLGRVSVRMPEKKAPFNPNRIVRKT